MLSYDCFLCVLVLFQGFRRFRSDSSIFRSGKRLVSILIRDSVIYFLVCVFYPSFFFVPYFETDIFSFSMKKCSIFATYLTCLLVWAFARVSLKKKKKKSPSPPKKIYRLHVNFIFIFFITPLNFIYLYIYI